MPVEKHPFSGEKSVNNLWKTLHFWGKFESVLIACGKSGFFFHRFSTGRKASKSYQSTTLKLFPHFPQALLLLSLNLKLL
jgi:hypothetical protein